MPVPLYTQTVIAFIWDFDRTLIPGNQQDPLFESFGVDPDEFWHEVEGLTSYYESLGVVTSRDLSYLNHLLTYVEAGLFDGLNRAKLRQLGEELEPCPGIPEFLETTRSYPDGVAEFKAEGISVEHYVVSTGIRSIIEGSPIAAHVDGIWANDFIETPAPPGYRERLGIVEDSGVVSQLGYAVDNTSKTRAIFEINKGVGHNPDIDVNSLMSEEQRRVPIKNMIYIADGPSDVPVFSVLNERGGKTLGVYTPEPPTKFGQVKRLQSQGRIQGMAEADYRQGKAAALWLIDSLEQIGWEIVEARRQAFSEIPKPPRH